MKQTVKKGICYLLAVAFLLCAINAGVTQAQAATKYSKTITRTITLKRYTTYKIPIKMSKAADITVTTELLTSGRYLSVWFFPKDKNDEIMETEGGSGNLNIDKNHPEYDALTDTFTMKAPKGNSSYFYTYIVGDSEFPGDTVKIKLTVTCKKKLVNIGKLTKFDN